MWSVSKSLEGEEWTEEEEKKEEEVEGNGSFVGLGNLKYVNDANGAALGRPFYTYFMHMCLSLSLLLSLCVCVHVCESVSLAKTSSYIEIKTKLEQPPRQQRQINIPKFQSRHDACCTNKQSPAK